MLSNVVPYSSFLALFCPYLATLSKFSYFFRYPPSPPIYDVTDKLIEVNREFYNDPTSTCHLAGKVRWKPDENLVQIKWLYSSASERSFCYQQSESEEESSDENNEGLAAHLAREMKFFPPKIELTTIEDLSPDNSEQHTITLIEPPPIHFRNLPGNFKIVFIDEFCLKMNLKQF